MDDSLSTLRPLSNSEPPDRVNPSQRSKQDSNNRNGFSDRLKEEMQEKLDKRTADQVELSEEEEESDGAESETDQKASPDEDENAESEGPIDLIG